MLPFFVCSSPCHDLFKCSGSDSHWLFSMTTSHCVCFSATSLTVCKNSAIIAFEHIFNEHKGGLFIDLDLSCLHAKNVVKSEDPGRFIEWFWFRYTNLASIIIDVDYWVFWAFFRVKGTAPNHHFHILRHVLNNYFYYNTKTDLLIISFFWVSHPHHW